MTVSNWLELFGIVATVLPGLVPTSAHSMPYLGRVLYYLARASVLTPPDAKGTLKLPGGKINLEWESDPKPPADKTGFWPPISGVMLMLALVGCAGTQPSSTSAATRQRIIQAVAACVKAAVQSVSTSGAEAR